MKIQLVCSGLFLGSILKSLVESGHDFLSVHSDCVVHVDNADGPTYGEIDCSLKVGMQEACRVWAGYARSGMKNGGSLHVETCAGNKATFQALPCRTKMRVTYEGTRTALFHKGNVVGCVFKNIPINTFNEALVEENESSTPLRCWYDRHPDYCLEAPYGKKLSQDETKIVLMFQAGKQPGEDCLLSVGISQDDIAEVAGRKLAIAIEASTRFQEVRITDAMLLNIVEYWRQHL